jgi:uncharacterized membrane protein
MFKPGNRTLLLNLTSILLVVLVIFFPSNAVRIVVGLPFVVFLPGYVAMAAIYPGKGAIPGSERLALSCGISVATVIIIGLVLNYTPFRLNQEPVIFSLALFVLVASVTAWWRSRWLADEERFAIEFTWISRAWSGSVRGKIVFVILGLLLVSVLGAQGYAIARPKITEAFTEFYVLGMSEDGGYPTEMILGAENRVIAGIVNQENEKVSYRIEVRVNGVKNNEVGPIVLESGQRYETEVSCIPQIAGDNQKVEYLLYLDGNARPCLEPLHLWVRVIAPRY